MPRRILLLLGISHLAFGEVINLKNELTGGNCPNWFHGPPGWTKKDKAGNTQTVTDGWKEAGCDFKKDADDNATTYPNGKLTGAGCCGCWGYRILTDDNNLSARNKFDQILAKLNDASHKNGIYGSNDITSDNLAADDRTKVLKENEDSSESDSKEPWSQIGFRLCAPRTQYGATTMKPEWVCAHPREFKWTTEEAQTDDHTNDGVRCRNYGRLHCSGSGCATGDNGDKGLCMWEFTVDADKADKEDDHKFECHTTTHWRELEKGRGAEKAGMWIGIIFIAILMAWPACSRMPCYKKLCTAEHDLCCKTAKEEIKRRSTLQGNTSERELNTE